MSLTYIFSTAGSLRIRELEARNNVLDDAVELGQRAGQQRAANDETLL